MYNNVYVDYYNDKVSEIVLSSYDYDVNDIDPKLIEWVEFAIHGLTEKYGKPSKVYFAPRSINILLFKDNYARHVCFWTVGKYKISGLFRVSSG